MTATRDDSRARDTSRGKRWGDRLAAWYGRAVVRLRWVVVIGWVLVAAAVTIFLPKEQANSGLGGLLSANSPAARAEITSATQFAFPLLTREAVVQHNPHGLGLGTIANSVAQAVKVDTRTAQQGVQQHGPPHVAGVIPISNTGGLFPSSSEHGTTAISYVFTAPTGLSIDKQTTLAQQYAQRLGGPNGDVVGVAGMFPARVQQGNLISSHLQIVELATLAFIVLVVGLRFRSVVAPLLALVAAVLAYLVTIRVLGGLGDLTGLSVPQELEPLIVALLLGVSTDYCVFFLTDMRRELAFGHRERTSAHRATAHFVAIIIVAGLMVAGGLSSILFSNYPLFRSFGPGLAITVLIALVIDVSFLPATLAILGEKSLWPSHPSERDPAGDSDRGESRDRPQLRERIVARMSERRSAVVPFALSLAVLGLAVIPLAQLRLDMSVSRSLPAGNVVSKATAAASAGFAPGILSPTIVVATRPGLTKDKAALNQFQQELANQPGVAGVLGPRDEPLVHNLGVFQTTDGSAARYFVIFNHDPLGATAVNDLRQIRRALPELQQSAGLQKANVAIGGDTALAAQVATRTKDNLGRIGVAAFLIELLLLAIFLRSGVAPFYLMFSSVLSVAAALGLTAFVFQDVLGHPGVTFYVPFAAGVLLIALGSDYNVFGVGRIWDEARGRSLRDAIRIAVPRSTRAINTAGVALAGSFALVALVPVLPFREVAFAMGAGLLLDTFVVRLLLVPCLVSIVGPASGWPGHRLGSAGEEAAGQEPDAAPS